MIHLGLFNHSLSPKATIPSSAGLQKFSTSSIAYEREILTDGLFLPSDTNKCNLTVLALAPVVVLHLLCAYWGF
jgi:hypothetical protein